MISYSKTESDIKNRIRDLAWMNGRFFVFAGVIVLPISGYYFLAGFVANSSEAIHLACSLLTLAAICFVVFGTVYSKTKKAVNLNFDKLAQENKIDFTLEKLDDALQFTRLSDGQVMVVSRSDIRSVKRLKTINVIVLKNSKFIDLPRRADIDEMISFS